jgi:hypothetical protein
VDVADLEVAFVVDAVQYLPGWTPAQMLQEFRE